MDNDHIKFNRRELQTNTVEAMDTEDGMYSSNECDVISRIIMK